MVIKTASTTATQKVAYELGRKLETGVICLYGNLGAGKTTFVQGLAKGLGILSKIQSPTFTYQRIHHGKRKLYHFDYYRIERVDSLLVSEMYEALEKKDGILAIEWAEKVADFLPQDRIEIYLEYVDEGTRRIEIRNSKSEIRNKHEILNNKFKTF